MLNRFFTWIISITAFLGLLSTGCQKETNLLAEVETKAAIVFGSDSALVFGRVITDNGNAVTERGICWSQTENPTIANYKLVTGSGTGSFECYITDLQPEKIYHVRAFAVNESGTAYGADLQLSTEPPAVASEVVTISAIPKSPVSADVSGMVVTDNGTPVTERGVVWNVTGNPTINDNKVIQGAGTGTFSCEITGLIPQTEYHVKAYATNQAGTSYGSDLVFETPNSIVATILDQPIILRTIDSVRSFPDDWPECPNDIFAYPDTLSMSKLIDVNNDGINDYNFELKHYNKECILNSHCPIINSYLHFLNVYRLNEYSTFINKTIPSPRFFTYDDLIAYDSANINGGHGALIKDTCEGGGGSIESLDNVYMGIIINDMLGWIHIDLQNNFEVVIKGWAINTVPFAPIRAGQTE